ncbi:MAG: ACP S-malonyltransferase, partial [Dehalococcoidia bacterium]|nr:ACP S-malonyltransferase [Dehalococcoidia bacterium]
LNCPGQVVISGAKQDLEKAALIGQERGGKRFMPLEVSGAFHSRWMSPARAGLKKGIESCRLTSLKVPLVANVSAREITSADEVRDELLAQLCGCVLWQSVIECMVRSGVTVFIEMGPGLVLAGLIKRTSKDAKTRNIGSAADLKNWTQ